MFFRFVKRFYEKNLKNLNSFYKNLKKYYYFIKEKAYEIKRIKTKTPFTTRRYC